MNDPSRHIINVSEEVYQRLTKNAKYGDSADSILRKLLRMRNRKLRRGPQSR